MFKLFLALETSPFKAKFLFLTLAKSWTFVRRRFICLLCNWRIKAMLRSPRSGYLRARFTFSQSYHTLPIVTRHHYISDVGVCRRPSASLTAAHSIYSVKAKYPAFGARITCNSRLLILAVAIWFHLWPGQVSLYLSSSSFNLIHVTWSHLF